MASLEIRNIGCLATPLGRGASEARRRARSSASANAAVRAEDGRLVFVGAEKRLRAGSTAGRPADAVARRRRARRRPGPRRRAHAPRVARRPRPGDRPAARRGKLRDDRGRGRRDQRHGPGDARRHATRSSTRRSARRLSPMLAHGTTTAEAKSGYGLTAKDEIRALRPSRNARQDPALPRLVPTLLAAHEIPPEFRENRAEWVRLVAEEIVPRAARERLARYCDVFCEEGVFTVAESRRILEAARRAGTRPAGPRRRARALGRRDARGGARRGFGRPPSLHRDGGDRGPRAGPARSPSSCRARPGGCARGGRRPGR